MNRIKEYYCNQLFITFHTYTRQQALGAFLILNQIGWFFYLLVNKQTLKQIEDSGFYSLHKITDFLDIDDNSKKDYSYEMFIVSLSVNIFIVLLFIIDGIYYNYSINVNCQQVQKTNIFSQIQHLLSFLLKVYTYLIYTPSLFFSLFYSNGLKITNAALTILIGVFVDIHDFNYSLNESISQDSLSKYPLILIRFLKKSLISILIINRAIYEQELEITICLIYSLFGIIYNSFFREYHQKKIRIFYYALLFLLAITTVICQIVKQTSIHLNFHLLFLVIVPIVIKIAYEIQLRQSSVKEEYQTLSQQIQKKNMLNLIYYIQDVIEQLDSFNHFDYYQNSNSIILESISCAHTQECQQKFCFCQEIVKGNKEQKQQKRKDHLILHIENLFKEILRSCEGLTSVHFYYINFLVDQAKSKARTLFQIQRIKHEFPKSSILFRVYFQFLTHKIKKSFKLENKNQLGDIVGLVFEEHLHLTSQIYESSLYQKLELLSYLNNDHINTLQVQKCCFDLYQSRSLLKEKITFLSKLNPSNEQLNIIKNGYNFNFCFVLGNNEDSSQLKTYNNQYYQGKVQNGTGVASSYRHNLFENDSCVLFLSAELSNLGSILKGQKSFEDMFGISNFIGKNIHAIIPNIMIQEHQQQMKQYLNNSEKKYSPVTYIPLALAKNADNFAVPVNIRATIDHVSAFDKIGFVCTISLNYSFTNCVLVQKDTFSLQLVSKQFYSTFLSKSFDTSEINHINASKIFPQLPIITLQKGSLQSGIKDVLMILPAYQSSSLQHLDQNITKDYFKASSLTDKILKWSEQEICQNTKNFIYYYVQLEIQSPNNTEFPFFIVSVKNSQRVSNLFEIQPLIHQLQEEYAKLNKQSSSFDIESLSNVGQSTRVGNSENFQLNDHNSLVLMKNSQSQIVNQQKPVAKTKTLFPDYIQNNKYEEPLSSRNEYKDSPYLNVSKRSNSNLILDKTYSPSQNNHEISHSIFQDHPFTPFTNRQTDRESQSYTTRNNLEFELSKVLFSSPRQHEEDLIINERHHIKQLPEKFWKASPGKVKTLDKSQSQEQRLSRDIVKRLQAYKESIENDKNGKKKEQEKGYHQSPPNNQHQPHNNQGFSQFKGNMNSSLHNSLLESKKSDQQEIKEQGDLIKIQNQELQQKQDQQHFLQEKFDQQVSFIPQDKILDDQSNNSQHAENGKKLNYQQSSLVSSSNSTREALKQVEKKIMTSQSSLGLRILNLFGLVSVISISLAIILQGLQITEAFDKASIDFNFVSWPMDISSTMSQIQLYTIEYYMSLLYLIPGLSTRWKTYKTECLDNIKTLNQEWTTLWMDQVRSDQQQTPYFYNTLNRNITWYVNRDKKSYKGQQTSFTTSEFYFVQNYLTAYKSYFTLLSDDFNQQAILIENYKPYFAQASQVKENILETSISSLESITTNSGLLMILCISLSFCMIIFIFPIYAYLQSQNEQTFKLMATLNTKSIISMSKQAVQSLSTYQYALQQYKRILKSTENINQKKQNNIENILQKELPIFSDNQKQFILKSLEKPNKKKTISTNSPLSKFSFNLLFISLLVFTLIITLPIISYLLIQNFQEESILNVRVLNSLYDLKNSFSYSYYLILGVVYNSIENTTLYKGYFFAQRVPTFFTENAEKLSNIIAIISESSARTRFHNSDYESFFYEILKADVCTPLTKYSEFAHQDKYPIDLSICKTIRGGILSKGYQTASKYFFDSLQAVYDITLSTPSSQLKAKLREWEKSFDIPNYNIYFRIMIQTITILKDFMKEKGDLYLSQMKTTQNLISIFEIIILFLLFLFWWVFFYRKMQFEVNHNRRLLSLLDIQAVMENTYMITYISKIKTL